MPKTIAYFLLACLIIHTGYSFKCYQCILPGQNGCNDPIDTSAIQPVDCLTTADLPDAKPVCYKQVGSINGQSYISRGCSYVIAGQDYCSIADQMNNPSLTGITIDSCKTCDSDNCNGASKPFSGMLFLIVVPSLAVIMTTYFNA